MAFAPEIPSSLNPGATPALRRVLAAVAAPNGAPAGVGDGFATGFVRSLNFALLLTGGGAVITYRVWYWQRAAEVWCVDTRPAPTTAGVITFDTATMPNPELNCADINGLERVYIEVLTLSLGATVDAWIEGVTF